jgi:hypothetical protein
MKRWVLRAVVLAALIALGVWGWRVFFPSPEQAIRNRLAELAQAASFSPNEGPLAKLSNAQKLTTFCAGDVAISVDVPGHSQIIHGREELLQVAIGVRSVVSGVKLRFLDTTVAVGADKASAVANLTAKANVAGESDFVVQELKFTFKKIGRDWLISRVETVKTLL